MVGLPRVVHRDQGFLNDILDKVARDADASGSTANERFAGREEPRVARLVAGLRADHQLAQLLVFLRPHRSRPYLLAGAPEWRVFGHERQDQRGDLVVLLIQGEMAGVQQVDLRVRQGRRGKPSRPPR